MLKEVGWPTLDRVWSRAKLWSGELQHPRINQEFGRLLSGASGRLPARQQQKPGASGRLEHDDKHKANSIENISRRTDLTECTRRGRTRAARAPPSSTPAKHLQERTSPPERADVRRRGVSCCERWNTRNKIKCRGEPKEAIKGHTNALASATQDRSGEGVAASRAHLISWQSSGDAGRIIAGFPRPRSDSIQNWDRGYGLIAWLHHANAVQCETGTRMRIRRDTHRALRWGSR